MMKKYFLQVEMDIVRSPALCLSTSPEKYDNHSEIDALSKIFVTFVGCICQSLFIALWEYEKDFH